MSTTTPEKGTTATAVESPTGFTHKQIMTILAGLLAGMFLAALDQTIVSTSIRTIADDLNGLSVQAWVTTAYLITSTVSTPLYGKLSDIYGRRPLFVTAIVLFVVGSFACAFATSMPQLAAFRAFQGLGAGGLFSLALAIIADIVPPRERAKYQGYFLAVFGTSSVIGPLVGGLFAGADTILWITGWRWVFLVNVPIGAIALLIVWKNLHLPHMKQSHRIDWWGAAALIVGIVPILTVAEQGRTWGWASAASISMMVLGVLGIAAFVAIEFRMKDEALIPMRLFRSRVFSTGLGAGVLVGVGMFGALSCLPLYLQLVKGASPTASGLLLLPMMIGIMSGSIASGQITSRTGKYKMFPVIGTALLAAAFFLLLTVKIGTPYWQLDIYFLMVGVGLGLNMQTLTIAVQNAVPARDIGVATSSVTFFRQMGGTLGVAVFLSLLFNSVPSNIAASTATLAQAPAYQQAVASAVADPTSPSHQLAINLVAAGRGDTGAQAAIQDALNNDSSFLGRVDPLLAEPFKQAFVDSTHLVYLVGGIVMVLAFLLVLTLKEIPLRTMSAIDERRAEEASLAAETLPPSGLATTTETSTTGATADAPAAGSTAREVHAGTSGGGAHAATGDPGQLRVADLAARPTAAPSTDGTAPDGTPGRHART
ncbi:MFS transporter [Nakamurella flavida]|uniref:MFS transporter n=1 Tax=Nakamurella flavida TaxID=363630 RepID=A0A939C4Y7_9ACTN|nr:MDR family MFS transporter [Nakamurella flavida]MBM9476234.1 MFS transporter [Nakamurella flavida]MDP9779668.1 EmrB/QacA subfamily drug resistance transporter [Nakamurella flavida]